MPFAISNQTGQVIGIGQASRGDTCDCRCLSCNTHVTARKGDVNQWHFSHRTNEASTSNECDFSPVTALALIVRQELHHLRDFDLDEWAFSNIEWAIDTSQHGFQCDAYTKDSETNVSILMEIPFANGKVNDVEQVPDKIDIVLRVNTQLMADSLYQSKSEYKRYSSKEIFDLLLDHWGEWTSMERWPQDTKNMLDNIIGDSYQTSVESVAHVISSNRDELMCACCGTKPGQYGKGLLCKPCVNRHVGRTFNSISDMVSHYKKNSI
ncbi:hypothetical protein BCS95_09250 [Vibrio breoganii]|nr:hypothetical protein BCS95_09250 [Vibrio breoganii]